MKNFYQHVVIAVSAAAFVQTFAGCSTSGKKAESLDDKKAAAEAAAKSQVYLSGVDVMKIEGKLADAKPCTVPPEAQKAPPGQGTGQSKDWRKLVGHANTCVKEKNWKTLETLAAAIARIDIDSPWGAYYLSLAAEGAGENQRALWMIDLAQKKAGGTSGLFAYQKGRLFFALGEIPRAMKEVEKAVQIDTRLGEGYLFLAEIYHRDLEYDRAVAAYRAALQNDGKSAKALTGLAEVRLVQGAGVEAADLYAKAVLSQPENLRLWLRLAYIFESVQKNSAQALATYRDLKTSIDRGQIRERTEFDLGAKIKALEDLVKPRVPAQAAVSANAKPEAVAPKSVK